VVPTSELTGGAASLNAWTVAPNPVTLTAGDRIGVRVYLDDAGGTMASGRTASLFLDGPTAGLSGDSYVGFTENMGEVNFAATATAFVATQTAMAFTATPTVTFTSTVTSTSTDTSTVTDTPTITQTATVTASPTVVPSGNKVYLTSAASSVTFGTDSTLEAPLVPGLGAVPAVATVNTAAGPTAPIQFTASAGGTALTWVSVPLQAVTLSGNVNFNLWAAEANNSANAGITAEVLHLDYAGNVLGTIASAVVPATELNGGAPVAMTWTVIPVSTSILTGERVAIRVYIDDAGGAMAGGKTATLDYDRSTASVDGDSWVSFTESLNEFVPTPTVTPTGTASNTPGPGTPSDTPTATLSPTITNTPVPGGGKTSDVITPDHAGGAVMLYLYQASAKLAVDVYALDNHKVAHTDVDGVVSGPVTVWTTAGVAPGVYYLKVSQDKTDGSNKTEIKKVILRP
jgi:hypothetical protein